MQFYVFFIIFPVNLAHEENILTIIHDLWQMTIKRRIELETLKDSHKPLVFSHLLAKLYDQLLFYIF